MLATKAEPMEVLRRWQERSRESQKLLKKAKGLLPMGVGSHFRAIDPNPIFVDRAKGTKIWDADGNEYIDFAMCFGALFVGHAHPKIVEAVSAQVREGTMYTMPHKWEAALAQNLIERFPMDMARFTNSGTESTMHAIRVARSVTKRKIIIKFAGCYHGCHDQLLASVKPDIEKLGGRNAPNLVPSSTGIPEETLQNTRVASFNNLDSVKRIFKENPNQIAAAIIEPAGLNMGICLPQDNFLKKLQDLCHENGALFILDEVKTGAKIAKGGACEYFRLKPDLICLAKAIGGGLPLGAFGGIQKVMSALEDFSLLHVGTYNTNPLCMRAGYVTCAEILTDDVYPKTAALSKKLADGYDRIIKTNKLPWHTRLLGPMGTISFTQKPISDYHDWSTTDVQVWKKYWFGMCNEGVIPTPYGWDEQWTISVQHTQTDIEAHLAAFEKVAPTLKD